MILVVVAVAAELKFWSTREHVEVLVCGIGPVESAIATSRALAQSRPTAVVNVGIAGGFRGGAQVGDAVVVANEHFAELGLEDHSAMPMLPGGAQLVVQAHSDAALLAGFTHGAYSLVNGVTVASVTTSTQRAQSLAQRFDATVESMEGFAVLRACEIAAVPALELRGVSNIVGPRASAGWDFSAGARAAAYILDAFLDAVVERAS